MKTTKKVLSVLLAVIMIMSSMSVCFGSLAAPSHGKTADYQALAKIFKEKNPMGHVEAEMPIAAGSGSNISTVTDKSGAFFEAAAEWYDLFVEVWDAASTSGTNDSGIGIYRLSDKINEGILTQLKDGGYMTASEITACKVADFLNLMVGNVTPSHTVNSKGLIGSLTAVTGVTGGCNITLDVDSYLASFTSIDDIPASIPTSAAYKTVNMDNQQHSKGSGLGKKTYSYAAIRGTQDMTESVTYSTTIKTGLASAKKNLADNVYYFGENALIDVVNKGKSTLETAKTAISSAYDTVYNSTEYTGADVWNKFFSTYDTEVAVENIDEALAVHAWKTTVDNYKAALATDYSGYTSAQMLSLWNTLITYRDSIDNATDSAVIKEYFNVDSAANQAIIDTLKSAYDNKVIAEHRDIALELFDEYKDWTAQMVYDGEITEEDLIEAAAKLDTEYAIFVVCDPAVVDQICGEGFMEQFADIYNRIDALANAIAAQKNFIEAKEKFDSEVKPATPADADFNTLFANVQNYDQWYSNLRDYVEAIRVAYGDELADKIMNHYDETMTAHMDAAYKVLSDVSEAQIEIAYDVYEEYVAIYGEGGTFGLLNNLLTYKNQIEDAIGTVDADLYEFLCASENDKLPEETIAKLERMKALIKAYTNFDETKGFDVYQPSSIDDIVRKETADDIAREGDYTVTDEKVEEIIDTLENVLADPAIKALLGELINKDEDGNPTGEPFDIGALLTTLIEENVYSDALINTIIQFIYPAVANIFTEVWMGINPKIDDPNMAVMGQTVSVTADLYLLTVEEATAGLGLPIFPDDLANTIRTNYNQFSAVADVLDDATSKAFIAKDTEGNWDESTRVSPWNDAALYTAKLDKDGNAVVNEETGETTMVLNLNWGIDELEGAAKRERFLQAIQAALIGLEPILLALLCNSKMNAFNEYIGYGWGQDGLKNFYVGDVVFWEDVTLTNIELDIHTIDLRLTATANDGYNNVIAPLFELLGVTAPNGKTFTSTRDVIEKGLLEPLDAFIAKLSANPIETILDILPNLAYAIEADLLLSKLDYLYTKIEYSAGATINADLNNCESNVGLISTLLPYLDGTVTSMTGLACKDGVIQNVRCNDVMTDKIDVAISTFAGDLLTDLDLSSFQAIWNMLTGSNEALAGVSAPNAQFLATMGELKWINTVRSIKSYNYGAAGKAAHIVANRADVLLFLVKWALSSGLLGAFVKNPNELVNTIFTNLATDTDNAIAAIVELLKAVKYDTLEEYEWYDGIYSPADDLNFTPATEIYMNPGNDWTEAKAEYLYNNLETLLTTALSMAGVDLDLEALVGDLVNGLLTDKTLTALAGLLAKLDLNALVNKDKTPTDEGYFDVNELVVKYLGLDLAAVAAEYADIAAELEANEEYVYEFGVDAGTTTFADALADMLAPLSVVLDYILADGNITITLTEAEGDTVTLYGSKGYDSAVIPLLEALGCDVTTASTGVDALKATINSLVGLINKLTTNTEDNAKDGLIYGVIDLLPSLLYFLTSNGLSTVVRNLLQPIYVILDTIRPIYDVDLEEIINGIEALSNKGLTIDLDKLDGGFVVDLVSALTGLNLAELETLIYDVADLFATDYESKSTLQTNWKKGAYTTAFDQADMITVILSFVLEWATVADNAAKLDEMLNTKGIIASLNTVFADVEITYGTPNWLYWFSSEEVFDAYIASGEVLPNTLAALDWNSIDENEWDLETAQYFANNISVLVDAVIAMINADKEDAPKTVAALVDGLIADYISADTINMLVDYITDFLGDIDETLIDAAGYILGVDLVGLKKYRCTAEIDSVEDFTAELANVLDTYAGGLINWLFFGDDYRFAKKSDNTDTIVINGGLGYEKGLAIILEALGCDVPAANDATTANVLVALGKRADAILAAPVNEVLDILPNLIYFLNANGAGVAISNLLAPVNVLLDKLASFGLNLDINELIGIDLSALSLENVVAIVEDATGLTLDAAEEILVNFCTGKITKGEFTYKMSTTRENTITILLYVALSLVSDDTFAAQLDEMLGVDIVAKLKEVFAPSNIEYVAPEWDYAKNNSDYLVQYPNNWNRETAAYVADVLVSEEFDALIAGLIDSNYASLSDLLADKVNVFTSETLESLVGMIKKFIVDIDDGLLKAGGILLNVNVAGLKEYKVPAGITTVDAFAAELANILNTYAKGLVEWFLLGDSYTFFVGGTVEEPKDIITITGADGYANGLALLLEALGCENLPVADGETEAIISGVLNSLAARINDIFEAPIAEVIELLPNLIYFLNANGVSAAINNTLAAITALLDKLAVFGINIDIDELVDLKGLMGLADTDAAISLDNLSMAAVLEAVGLMVGLDLTVIEGVLVGFDLGPIDAYTSVSDADVVGTAKKMSYAADEFIKDDMLTVILNIALLTVADENNAEFIKGLVGEDVYSVIVALFNMSDAEVQEFAWKFTSEETGGNKVGETFSALETSVEFVGEVYGKIYTKEQAQYIADNFGDFINNIVYLLGLDVNGDGKSETNLTDLINGLIDGNLYNSSNVIAIRDALAGVASGILELNVKGANVGGYIAEVLKKANVADLAAVADVDVPEFTEDRAKFVEYLCAVLEPIYPIIKYVLADEDIAFFVNLEQTDAIALKGAEGYAYGIIPLLEVLECENILAPADYYEAIEADGSVLLTSILNPLLDRVDEIIANPAEEILDMLPNIIYFINSNGVDTVVKNALGAVFTLLSAIKPIAKLDLYELIGVDLATINFEWILDKVLGILNDMGYNFTVADLDAVSELTVGTLEAYTSLNGKTAYKMVYAKTDDLEGGKAEMVTVIERLAITFLTAEENQEAAVKFLKEKMNMNATAENYVRSTIKLLAECIDGTSLGMQSALATVYYLFYGVDIGVGETADGLKDLNTAWKEAIAELKAENSAAGELIEEILGWDIFDDVIDTETGVAPNGLMRFFQKIIEWFKGIGNFFTKLFSFGK